MGAPLPQKQCAPPRPPVPLLALWLSSTARRLCFPASADVEYGWVWDAGLPSQRSVEPLSAELASLSGEVLDVFHRAHDSRVIYTHVVSMRSSGRGQRASGCRVGHAAR